MKKWTAEYRRPVPARPPSWRIRFCLCTINVLVFLVCFVDFGYDLGLEVIAMILFCVIRGCKCFLPIRGFGSYLEISFFCIFLKSLR